jgi:DNA-binding Xre family transcriptional regulator
MTSPQSPAIAAQRIVVGISWVLTIGTASSSQRLAEVLRNVIILSLLGISLQVLQGNISRLERGDVEDVHVSTLLRLAQALGATVNDLLRDFQDEHEDVKVSSTRENWDWQPPCNQGASLLTYDMSVLVQSSAPATAIQPRLPRTASGVPCLGTERSASLWTQPRCRCLRDLWYPSSSLVFRYQPLASARAWRA